MAWDDYTDWTTIDTVRLTAPLDGILPVIKAVNERCQVAGLSTIPEMNRLNSLYWNGGYSYYYKTICQLIEQKISQLIPLFINHTDNGGSWDGQTDIPAWTESSILTAIGANSRIAAPSNVYELSVDWLYQQYLILNKLVLIQGINTGTRKGRKFYYYSEVAPIPYGYPECYDQWKNYTDNFSSQPIAETSKNTGLISRIIGIGGQNSFTETEVYFVVPEFKAAGNSIKYAEISIYGIINKVYGSQDVPLMNDTTLSLLLDSQLNTSLDKKIYPYNIIWSNSISWIQASPTYYVEFFQQTNFSFYTIYNYNVPGGFEFI